MGENKVVRELPRWGTGPLPRHAALAIERACNPAPVVRMTLEDLEAAVERERLSVYDISTPTGPRVGRRWLTRQPRFWRGYHQLLGPLWNVRQPPRLLLREVTPLEVDDGVFLIVAWQIEIAGETELLGLLHAGVQWLSDLVGSSLSDRLAEALRAGGTLEPIGPARWRLTPPHLRDRRPVAPHAAASARPQAGRPWGQIDPRVRLARRGQRAQRAARRALRARPACTLLEALISPSTTVGQWLDRETQILRMAQNLRWAVFIPENATAASEIGRAHV